MLLINARNASSTFRMLSHESRLMILCLLTDGEKCVSELKYLLNRPQAAVSQQLARLRWARLVNTRRDGQIVFYSLTEDATSVLETLYPLFRASDQSSLAYSRLSAAERSLTPPC